MMTAMVRRSNLANTSWGRGFPAALAMSLFMGLVLTCLGQEVKSPSATDIASETSSATSPPRTAASEESGSEVTERARGYVQRLGDPRFAVREHARQQLIGLGLPSLPALEQGTLHPDREIRHGSRRLLAMIQLHDFQRRLDAFAADVGGESDHGLPAWKSFRDTFGEGATTRSVFVEMLQAEAGLLQALDEGYREAINVMGIRIQQIQQATARTEIIPVGGIAAMLFVLGQDELNAPTAVSQVVFQACLQAHFHGAMTEGAQQRIIRALLARAIRKATDWSAYQALQLAMRYDLSEGLVPAQRVLEDPAGNENLNYVRQFAILTLAKFGDSTHTPLLEGLLGDATPCSSMTINMVRYETQIRDIALASLWKINGEDPARRGFSDRIQRHAQIVFSTGTLGFADESARSDALRQWHEFRSAE